jgi:SNF2 family DNA or RNA helicase
MEERNKAIERFLSRDDCRVLIATPGAAKEGLTLTVANHVIFYDRSFSLDDYLQAQDRIHRISQKKTCHVYNLIMENSIDEWVDMLLHSKQLAAQLLQGDISLEFYKSQMSYEFGDILRGILGIDKRTERDKI